MLLTETLSGDVGESASVAVEVGLVLLAELVEVCLHGIVLVRGTLPVVGETTRGEESSSLVEVAGRTNRGDERAGSRVLRGMKSVYVSHALRTVRTYLGLELGRVLAVVGKAGRAGTRVAGGEDNGDTTATELGEEVADAEGV